MWRCVLRDMAWGNLDQAGGTFFWAGFWNIRISCITVGEPCQGWGNLAKAGGTFFDDGFRHIKQISTDCGGTWLGGTFFGAGFGHIKQISTNSGGTWIELGELFFPGPSYLTLTKARTPTARRC